MDFRQLATTLRTIEKQALTESAVITESSTLTSIGVDSKIIGAAHREQGLKQDEQLSPIKTKTELQQVLKKGHIVVVVGEQSSVITLARSSSIYINRSDSIEYKVVNNSNLSGKRVSSISVAMKLAGRGKYYASKKSYYSSDSVYRTQQEKDDWNSGKYLTQVRNEIVAVYGEFLRTKTVEAMNRIKAQYMDAIEDGDQRKLRSYQDAIDSLKKIRELGYPAGGSWGFNEWYSGFLQSINQHQTGFGSVPANKRKIQEIVKTPLFKQQYVKFVLNEIRKIEQRANGN